MTLELAKAIHEYLDRLVDGPASEVALGAAYLAGCLAAAVDAPGNQDWEAVIRTLQSSPYPRVKTDR